MSWNYRILERRDQNGDRIYAIHEVYYNDKNKPVAASITPSLIIGNSVADLLIECFNFSKAFLRPVLNWEDISKQ